MATTKRSTTQKTEDVELPGLPSDSLLGRAIQYLSYRRGRESLQAEEDTLKKGVMEELSVEGEPDEKGNRFFDFGFTDTHGVTGLKRERRVSQNMDEDEALALIKKYGLEKDCLTTITVINEDGILAANFAGTISDEEMKALYSEKESFALVLVKE